MSETRKLKKKKRLKTPAVDGWTLPTNATAGTTCSHQSAGRSVCVRLRVAADWLFQDKALEKPRPGATLSTVSTPRGRRRGSRTSAASRGELCSRTHAIGAIFICVCCIHTGAFVRRLRRHEVGLGRCCANKEHSRK